MSTFVYEHNCVTADPTDMLEDEPTTSPAIFIYELNCLADFCNVEEESEPDATIPMELDTLDAVNTAWQQNAGDSGV